MIKKPTYGQMIVHIMKERFVHTKSKSMVPVNSILRKVHIDYLEWDQFVKQESGKTERLNEEEQ